LLERVPANVNAFNAARTVGEETKPGLSSANLRGLGGGSTLVLLNGRRLANYAFDGESVDLNSIPLAAIDRVEVLKDGASAIYGSDAIAGVINFILRKDYAGAEIAGNVAATQHGGGNEAQLNFAIGFGHPARDGYNVFASLAYQKQQSLRAIDRDFARTAYRPDIGLNGLSGVTFPANIADRPNQRILNPAESAGCAPPSNVPFRPFPFRTPACGYDAATAIDLLPEVERASALLRGTWRAGPGVDVFAEALLGWNRFEAQNSPMPVIPVGNPFGPPIYPAGGPFYPTAFAAANGLSGDLVLAYLATELGPRFNTTTSDVQRYVVGAEGQRAGWDFNLAAVYSTNRQELAYGGSWLNLSKFIAAMRTGLINPWGPSGPEGLALLGSTAYNGTPQTAHGSTSLVNAFASREIKLLPAGPLSLALGTEARQERLSYEWDPAVLSGFTPVDNVQQSKSGSRGVVALFAEMNVPIVRGLGAQLAVRFDDYNDFGSTTNPKVALRWQPFQQLVLRASWGTGFRAPPLYSLSAPTGATQVIAGIPDPIRCPVTGALADCFILLQASAGGNPNLQPETSTQWNFGAVWEPARGLSLGIDYWNIEQEGIIAGLTAENALKYYERFNDRIIRGPVDPTYPTLPGPIVALDLSPINLGSTKTSGIDVFFNGALPSQNWGQVRAAVHGTYVVRYDTQIDGVQYVSMVGSAVYGAPIPRWRSTLTLDWNKADWGATLTQAYSGGYTDQFPGSDGGARKVGAASSWDLQFRYGGFSSWQFAIGIKNLFDDEPPSSNQLRTIQVGYNPQTASPLGRTFYLRGTFAIK
jgi:iron complex outermembrane receptor protein